MYARILTTILTSLFKSDIMYLTSEYAANGGRSPQHVRRAFHRIIIVSKRTINIIFHSRVIKNRFYMIYSTYDLHAAAAAATAEQRHRRGAATAVFHNPSVQ